VLSDRDIIVGARAAATELVDADPALAGYPALAGVVGALAGSDRAEYLEKA
jgi:ATP-dependent DNA helicase RecG